MVRYTTYRDPTGKSGFKSFPNSRLTTADPVRRGELLRAIPVGVGRWLPLLLAFTAMFAGIRALREASREMVAPVLQVGDFTMFLLLFAVFRPLARVVVTRWGAVLFAIAGTAALSFLGLGAQPPMPEWGSMLGAERNQVFSAPHLVFLPGIAIMVTVLGFNLLGDGLRDALDPRLNR